MSKRNFISELKRRKVFKVAAGYAVIGWLVIEVAATIAPQLNFPEWVPRLITFVILLGFPIAVVMAWLFDVTPEGIKLDASKIGSKRIFTATAIIAALALGWYFKGSSELLNQTPNMSAVDAHPQPVVAPMASGNSIAVLPFVNMSPDSNNEYFADGISEELLNILAGIDGLKVASRTSAFSFKGKDTPIPEIARQLDVFYVLEGSVRKQGNQVRITAQLIEAGSDAHLWTQTYQRNLDDIFLVQEEIAGAITVALKDILGAQQVKVDAPTLDMDAYQRYLHGRSRFYQRFELDQAIEDLRFAVKRDPDFAEAWAFLAASYWLVGNTGYASEHVRSDMAELAGPAVDKAITLKSDMPIALALKGRLIIDSDTPNRVAEGIRLMERAAALPAADTTPKLWLSLIWLELGYLDRALPLLESARRLDPLVGINSGTLGLAKAIEGRRTEADALVLRAVELDGLSAWANILAVDRVHNNDRKGAAKLVAAMVPLFSNRYDSDRVQSTELLRALQDPSREQGYLQQLASGEISDTYALSSSLMFERGAQAFKLVETGQTKTWIIINAAWMPAMQWLREDPRYFRMMQKNGRVEYWARYGYPRGCKPVNSNAGKHLACPETSP